MPRGTSHLKEESAPGATAPVGRGDGAATVVTRWVAGAILLFLLDAAQLLLLLPARTGELFAWPVRPDVNAIILGSAYVAGGYFFLRVCTGTPWHRVAAGFPPVVVFVWLAAIATFLHLDRLNDGGLPLLAWIALYVLSPVLVPLLYVVNERRAGGPGDARLRRGVRLLLAGGGGVVTALALVVFAAPGAAADAWPWPLTPLTARVVAAVMALYGAVWLMLGVRSDAAGARIPLEAHAVGLVVLLAGLAYAGDDVDWGNGLAVVFAAAAAVMLVATVTVRLSLRAAPSR